MRVADSASSPEAAFDPVAELRARQEAILARAKQEVSEQLDPLEHRVFEMMFGPSGASVEGIASAIGTEHLPLEERRRAAKQITERITKRIRRAAIRIGREAS